MLGHEPTGVQGSGAGACPGWRWRSPAAIVPCRGAALSPRLTSERISVPPLRSRTDQQRVVLSVEPVAGAEKGGDWSFGWEHLSQRAWLLGQLANAARKGLSERLLGSEKERALHAAAQAAHRADCPSASAGRI